MKKGYYDILKMTISSFPTNQISMSLIIPSQYQRSKTESLINHQRAATTGLAFVVKSLLIHLAAFLKSYDTWILLHAQLL